MPLIKFSKHSSFIALGLTSKFFIGILCVCWLGSCQNKVEQGVHTLHHIPSYFPLPLPEPEANPSSLQGVALGKMLFFDKALSPNEDIACSSCHKAELWFADTATFSVGHDGEQTKRNTPALLNLAWAPTLFWDGGGANLESVSLAPLHQQGEMGWQNLKDLETRLCNHAKYPKHFQDVFGTEAIEIAHVLRALAQYQRSILHTKSRWDKWKQGLIDFSAEEVQGWVLFQKHCDVCHTPPLFSDFQYHLVAADSVQHALALDDPERGRARISQQVADEGAYRTPTLRGLNKTWPYLHDGRFKTLEQLFFAPDFDSLHAKGMLSQKEKMLLINFLKALN